jgi:alpha-beta hydrolase superfamily lysophospholipase
VLVLVILAGLWTTGSAVLYTEQTPMLFPSGGPNYTECEDMKRLGGVAEERVKDGQLVRYVLFKGAQAKATVLFFHGNGGTVCYRAFHAEHLRSPDYDLVMLEYPGYGADPIPPSQARILPNALAAYDLFKADHPERPILLFGKSLGSGPATYVAAQRPASGLIAQTPYPSINAVADQRFFFLPVSWLNHSPFYAKDWAPLVECPVLVLHGTDDEVIHFKLGKEEAGRFKHLESLAVFQGAHHTDMPYREPERYWGLVSDFLHKHMQPV